MCIFYMDRISVVSTIDFQSPNIQQYGENSARMFVASGKIIIIQIFHIEYSITFQCK